MSESFATMPTGHDSGGERRITGRTVLLAMIAFFSVIFIANGFLLYFAFTTFSGLEGKSAYEAGLRFEERAIQAEQQAELGWTVAADVARAGQSDVVIVDLHVRDRQDAPVHGMAFTATFERLTQQDDDVAIRLSESEAGRYIGQANAIPAGQWRLVITGEDADSVVYRSANRIVLED
ncbi:MAG: FixH family protein [Pseudomonadota bacterium]